MRRMRVDHTREILGQGSYFLDSVVFQGPRSIEEAMLPHKWTCPPLSKEGPYASASSLSLRRRVSTGVCWFSLLYRMPHALHNLPGETSCERERDTDNQRLQRALMLAALCRPLCCHSFHSEHT